MWKKLSSKVVLDHPRLMVVEDEVELPSGKKTGYLRFEHNGNGPTAIAINSDNKILVIKEYFYVTNEWFYLFPGGFVPDSEDLEAGLKRELMEEAGVRANKLTVLGNFYLNIRRTPAKVDVFLAQDLEITETKLDEEEEIELNWFSEEEIDELIRENKFKNSPSLAAWAIYKVSKNI